MRDKWDEQLFIKLLELYQEKITSLVDKTNLIVLPESAIPLPQIILMNISMICIS